MIGQKFNAKEYTTRLKATIQSSGRLGFTADTIDMLQLTTECSVFLAPDDENKKIMYMGVVRERVEDAFPIASAGKYVYLNTTKLFASLKFDFIHRVYIFDLSRMEEGDEVMSAECYKMELRWTERTNNDKDKEQE